MGDSGGQCLTWLAESASIPSLSCRGVSDMQRKMAETSKSLVLLREQLKLLRKK